MKAKAAGSGGGKVRCTQRGSVGAGVEGARRMQMRRHGAAARWAKQGRGYRGAAQRSACLAWGKGRV